MSCTVQQRAKNEFKESTTKARQSMMNEYDSEWQLCLFRTYKMVIMFKSVTQNSLSLVDDNKHKIPIIMHSLETFEI